MVSVVLHAGLVTAPILAPLVAAKPDAPIEFVAVQIVPIQALGVREPTPAPSSPPSSPKPATREPEPQEPDPPAPVEPKRKRTVEEPRGREEKSHTRRPVPDRATAPAPARRRGSPRGSSLGTSTFGATVGLLDNPDFGYSYYIDQMLSMISANWLRPSLGGEIEAVLHFRIHQDGRISDLRVARSSGYSSFDLAGLRAVQSAAPFPRLPQTYGHDSLGVNLILR
ncbi:MAG: energy transducer TonB [Thermoanaerobaculia bacterium]